MKSLLFITFTTLLLVMISACSAAEESTTSTLSEQPDMEAYHKYFTELGIGKMPAEPKNPSEELQKDVSIFTAGDQICIYGHAIKMCYIGGNYYDVNAKEVVINFRYTHPKYGDFSVWGSFEFLVGKYECKVYAIDWHDYHYQFLVGVFPFEVR